MLKFNPDKTQCISFGLKATGDCNSAWDMWQFKHSTVMHSDYIKWLTAYYADFLYFVLFVALLLNVIFRLCVVAFNLWNALITLWTTFYVKYLSLVLSYKDSSCHCRVLEYFSHYKIQMFCYQSLKSQELHFLMSMGKSWDSLHMDKCNQGEIWWNMKPLIPQRVRPRMSDPITKRGSVPKCLMLGSISRFRFRQVKKLNQLKMMRSPGTSSIKLLHYPLFLQG